MENPTVSGFRSRSRSKTPFLRSHCDHENCIESDDHLHKSGRKTPVKRSTPIKQLPSKLTTEIITEEVKEYSSPIHYTCLSSTATTEKLVKTSDYSSEESPDRLKSHGKEIKQNEANKQHEKVSTSNYHLLEEFTLSPIHSTNVTLDRSSRIGSPSYSSCSTDSSFAEQALADASQLLDRDPSLDLLPYRLYKMAGEYWNKYPKTDFTYSQLSKDRVELAPGQVAVPNMSRRSLSMFRIQGPNTSVDEIDKLNVNNTHNSLRKRYTAIESSDDESYPYHGNGGKVLVEQRWWITSLLVSIFTTITSSCTNNYRKLFGSTQTYPYRDTRPKRGGFVSRAASTAFSPFYWIYTFMKTVVTSTVTTITETITPNHESYRYVRRSNREIKAKRSNWWPLLLLLLLPLLAYGCYNYSEYIFSKNETLVIDTYRPPIIFEDMELSKRMAALEDWALNVDKKINVFNQKLSKFDNFEQQIEQYSIKHLQHNLIQIFSAAENGEGVAAKLKQYFDQYYVNKEQMQALSAEIHERLINSWKPEMDEDQIRTIIQEYLSVTEHRQMELILSQVQESIKEIKVSHITTEFDIEAVKKLVTDMLQVYDADKTGLVDYAMESAGGQVISTKCTELYQIKTKQYSILGLPVWWVYTSPRFALTPGAMPAECWAFQGFPGYLVIRLSAVIEVTGFSLEHMSRLLAVDGKIESAPKNFSVYGLHSDLDPEPHLFGEYMYEANGTAIQYFPVKHPKTTNIGGVEYPVAYDMIELNVLSNHGNPTYTCVYRFRVHGNPLSDIRRATEDSIRDSET